MPCSLQACSTHGHAGRLERSAEGTDVRGAFDFRPLRAFQPQLSGRVPDAAWSQEGTRVYAFWTHHGPPPGETTATWQPAQGPVTGKLWSKSRLWEITFLCWLALKPIIDACVYDQIIIFDSCFLLNEALIKWFTWKYFDFVSVYYECYCVKDGYTHLRLLLWFLWLIHLTNPQETMFKPTTLTLITDFMARHLYLPLHLAWMMSSFASQVETDKKFY